MRVVVCVFTLIVSLLMTCKSARGEDPGKPGTVKIYLGWFHQFQFAGYYMAKELGYYEDEGLEVQLIPFDGSLGVDPILRNDYQYGIATAGQILGSESRDDLVVVSTILQQSPLALIVLRNSGIEFLKDLEGKKVGSGNELRAMLHAAGVDLSTIEFKNHTTHLGDLLSPNYDAISYYIIDSLPRREDFIIFRPIEYGINFYGECLYSTQHELSSNPDRIEAIQKATLKGWEYAVRNSSEVIEIIREKYNPDLTVKDLEREANVVINSLILTSFYPIGYNDMDKWAHIEKTLSRFITFENPVDWNEFIYQPERDSQRELLARVIRVLWIVGVTSGIIFLGLFIYNRQLRHAVRNRTKIIETAKDEIERKNTQLLNQKQELESLNYFKDKMLSVISHDVRSPLSTIQGLIEVTASGNISMEEFGEVAKHSRSKIQEINSFLENILYWAKNQLHGINLSVEPVNLSELSQMTVSLLSLSAENKAISITDNIPQDISVLADRETIKLVMRNLISNAIKFCNKNDKITLDAATLNGKVRVMVSDTGPGIEPEDLNKLFKSDQKSTPGSNNEVGTGLGLLLCKEFVEKNGGEIGVSSKVGEGSAFWFTVKLNES